MIMASFSNKKLYKKIKSKWFTACFKGDDHYGDGSSSSSFYKFKKGVGGKESMRRRKILMALANEKMDSSSSSSSDEDTCLIKKEKARRRFSRVLKAVFFEAYLSKKRQSKNLEEYRRSESSGSISSKIEKVFKSLNSKKSLYSSDNENSILGSNQSGQSSLFSSSRITSSTTLSPSDESSSTSSSIANSRSGSGRKPSCPIDLSYKPQKQYNKSLSMKRNGGGKFNSILGLYFLLICLVGLVFSGKAFAVFCTSTSLFLVPCRLKGVTNLEINDHVDSLDIDSEEYKKKVIMDGLLERNRSRIV